MSFKNTKDMKQLRRLERALRKGRLPRYFDLIVWLKDYGHAQTTGEALRLLESDKVLSDSHPLGKQIVTVGGSTKEFPDREAKKYEVLRRLYPVELRKSVHVID